jgi:hypothetical protein
MMTRLFAVACMPAVCAARCLGHAHTHAPCADDVPYIATRRRPQSDAPQWLAAAIAAPTFPGAAAAAAAAAASGTQDDASAAATAAGPSPLGDAEKRLFLAAALQSPALPTKRFEALFADMAKICRREESADVLGAYAM